MSSDIVEIIKRHAPAAIYVTSEADGHSDHASAFWFVRDAAVAAAYEGCRAFTSSTAETAPIGPGRTRSL